MLEVRGDSRNKVEADYIDESLIIKQTLIWRQSRTSYVILTEDQAYGLYKMLASEFEFASQSEAKDTENVIKPDWSRAPAAAKFHAIDQDGMAYWYNIEPHIVSEPFFEWSIGAKGGRPVFDQEFENLENLEIDWRLTCFERPTEKNTIWDNAPEWANFHAIDQDGLAYWYKNKPVIDNKIWDNANGRYEDSNLIVTSDWKQSLIERPR